MFSLYVFTLKTSALSWECLKGLHVKKRKVKSNKKTKSRREGKILHCSSPACGLKEKYKDCNRRVIKQEMICYPHKILDHHVVLDILLLPLRFCSVPQEADLLGLYQQVSFSSGHSHEKHRPQRILHREKVLETS
ncbi:hypothetical protein CapIbe_003886 [Capra ibex]